MTIRSLIASSVTISVLAGMASAQPAFFLLGKIRPVAAGDNPQAGIRIQPSYWGPVGMAHWNLREFPMCQIPYQMAVVSADNPAGAGAAAGVLNAARAATRTALADSFTTWENVAPSPIAFNRRADLGATAAARDQQNVMFWDNAVGAPGAWGTFGPPPSGTLAITFVWTNRNAQTQESDISFNDRDVQWNTTGATETFQISQAGPNANNTFPLANGDTLDIRVNGAAAVTVTFLAGNFVNIAQATPAEVAAVITTRFLAVGQDLVSFGNGNDVTLPANQRNRVFLFNRTLPKDGNATIQVTGGTANAAGKLNFPGAALTVSGQDIQSVATHEIGHMLGFHHSSQLSPEPDVIRRDSIMYFAAPPAGFLRVLNAIDTAGLNYAYTPDLGDAPDPCRPMAPFNNYQTLVHGNMNGRMLNGVQLTTVGLGPDHLLGVNENYRFEWLGDNEDGSQNECEARVPNMDMFDDGVTVVNPPLKRGQANLVSVKIKHRPQPGRYSLRTTPNDDVQLMLPRGRMPACGDRIPPAAPTVAMPNPPAPVNVPIIGPGPNGTLETVPNNCNTTGGDDQIVMIPNPAGGGGMIPAINTGANGLVETSIPGFVQFADVDAAVRTNGARNIFHLNGYADLNDNCLFDPAERAVFFSDIPSASLGPAPAARSTNFSSVLINASQNETTPTFNVFIPRNAPANVAMRFRLDYGEDEGRVAQPGGFAMGWEGDLAPAVGAAQYGEVEDYSFPTEAGPPPPDQLHILGPYIIPVQTMGGPDVTRFIEAYVELDFLGMPGQEVNFEILSGSARFIGLSASPDGQRARRYTGGTGGNPQAPGFVEQRVQGVAPGDGIIKVTVTDSPLVTYLVYRVPAALVAGDATGDSTVDFEDVTFVLENWGRDDGLLGTRGDTTDDGRVNFSDLSSVLVNWGASGKP